MPAGSQSWDANGNMVSDVTTAFGGFLGSIAITSSNQNGSFTVPGQPAGTIVFPFFTTLSRFRPTFSVSGHTISWTQGRDDYGNLAVVTGLLRYGVY